MRRLYLTAALCAVAMMTAPQPGVALDRVTHIDDHATSDISAAKKKKKRAYVHVYREPQLQRVRRPWADPSFDEYGRPYRSPYGPNTCAIDLGYGRFEPCDNVF